VQFTIPPSTIAVFIVFPSFADALTEKLEPAFTGCNPIAGDTVPPVFAVIATLYALSITGFITGVNGVCVLGDGSLLSG